MRCFILCIIILRLLFLQYMAYICSNYIYSYLIMSTLRYNNVSVPFSRFSKLFMHWFNNI